MAGRSKTAFLSGTITDNPLLIGATSINSAALANLPAITSPDVAVLVLDPTGSAGAPEVIWVTAHTGSATSATISRAKEGSTARQHANGIAWVHGPTIMDFAGRKGTDIASAGTITLPNTDEDYFHITGTTGITAISERGAGRRITFEFDGACALTHNATSLILPNGLSIVTRAGDILEFVSEASGNWRMVSPTPAAFGGWVLVGKNTAEQTTVSTTAVDLVTITGLSIPVTQAFMIVGVYRKTTGAAAVITLGLKLNTTVVIEAVAAGGNSLATTSTNNTAESGIFNVVAMPRSSNYLKGIFGNFVCYLAGAGGGAVQGLTYTAEDADMPNATITDIIIRAKSDNALVTVAVKDVFVYASG